MDEQAVLAILEKCGAVLTDSHFVYASGKHGSAYVNKDAVYPHTCDVADLCGRMVGRFELRGMGVEYDVVAGPEKGGIILSQWVAYNSAHWRLHGKEILAVYAEKDGDGFVFRRGYEKLIPGKKVLVVEDVLTTGGSARKVIQTVRALGGEVLGLAALCNRGGLTAESMGVPRLEALVNLPLEAWDEKDCPLCAQGVPINVDVGKGREFLARKAAEAVS